MRNGPITPLIGLIAAVLLALGLIGPAVATEPEALAVQSSPASGERVFAVYHGPVEVTLADASSDGHQLGDVRTASIETIDADSQPLGRLEAALTTTAIDDPAPGDEMRLGTLVFTFGAQDASQIVVLGSAHYPAGNPTVATGDTTVRPIVGGSGRFTGVGGEAVSSHLEDGSWVHEFHLRRSRGDGFLAGDPKQRFRESLREWRGQRADLRAQAKEVRQAERADRKEARDQLKDQRKAEREVERAERVEARQQRKADPDSAETAETAETAASAPDAAIDQTYTDAVADASGVVRTDLGIATPASALGQELGLWHYAIAAGEELAPHTHPGWQLARITAGELEYSVIAGEGVLLRADGSSETMGPGTYVLATGDGVIENPGLEHYGANRGEDVVTLISATLFEVGQPIATVIEDPALSAE